MVHSLPVEERDISYPTQLAFGYRSYKRSVPSYTFSYIVKWPDSRKYHVIDTFVSLHRISGGLYEHLSHFQQLSPYAQAKLLSTGGMRWEREQNSPASLPTGPGTRHREGWLWLGFSVDPHVTVPSDSGLYLFLSLLLAFLPCIKSMYY